MESLQVNWLPWAPDTFSKARAERKLIFLSIGYPACRWFSVMERECFQNPRFAEAANSKYICVKMDREIHPALDFVYMASALAIRKEGGWPNNMFLTPDLDPVLSLGAVKLDGLLKVMNDLDALWKKSESQIRAHASHITHVMKIHLQTGETPKNEPEPDLEKTRKLMDMKNGGFGTGSKFPMTGILEFLLTEGSDDGFLKLTLDKMARGGMFDHVGGGFFRCTADGGWEKPQFEKLLCDNALLASLYSRAAILFGSREYEYAARSSLGWIQESLAAPDGAGFYSSIPDDGLDEGERHLWSYDEALNVTGNPAFLNKYGITREGNIRRFEPGPEGVMRMIKTGLNVLIRGDGEPDELFLDQLHKARNRQFPHIPDRKIIAAWQGMAISAFVRAAIAFEEMDYLSVGERIGRHFLRDIGNVHYFLDVQPLGSSNLEDAAYLAMGYWDLFEATGKDEWLKACRDWVDYAKSAFSSGDGGYYLEKEGEGMILRPRNFEDQPYPSSSALLARVDWRLSFAMGQAQRATHSAASAINLLWSLKGGGMMGGEAMSLHREVFSEPMEILYSAAKEETNLLPWIKNGYARRWGVMRIPLGAASVNPALSFGRAPSGSTRAFVCYDRSCLPPAAAPSELAAIMGKMRRQ